MITEWLLTICLSIVEFIVGLLPEWEVPDFMQEFASGIADLFDMINGFGAWAPFAYLGILFGVILTTWSVTAIIKLVLRAASHIPGAGGAG